MRVRIDGAALIGGDDGMAAGGKPIGEECERKGRVVEAGIERCVIRLSIADGGDDGGGGGAERFGNEEDGAGEGGVAEEAGAAARLDEDGIERGGWDLVPQNVTGEGIVERDTIEEDEGAAGAARPEVAKGDALRGGIGGAAAVAPEEAEAGDLGAEDIVEAELWGALEVVGIEDVQTKWRGGLGVGEAIGFHHDAIGDSVLGPSGREKECGRGKTECAQIFPSSGHARGASLIFGHLHARGTCWRRVCDVR